MKRRVEPGCIEHRGFLQTAVLVPTSICLGDIAREGRSFKWERPVCPCGSPKVWGHGYVPRFFSCLVKALLLKRFRCPACRKIFTMMPEGYDRRYQTPRIVISHAIYSRLAERRWPQGVPRQRASHWLRTFLKRSRMDHPGLNPLDLLRRLLGDGVAFLV